VHSAGAAKKKAWRRGKVIAVAGAYRPSSQSLVAVGLARALGVGSRAVLVDADTRFGDPKSATSRRTISLPEEAIAALRVHRARQNQERLAAGQDWPTAG
jgi:hypothetical protein